MTICAGRTVIITGAARGLGRHFLQGANVHADLAPT